MKQPLPQTLFGALPHQGGVRFRLWAPDCRSVSLCLEGPSAAREIPLERDACGWCDEFVADAIIGTRYRYRIDGSLYVPDPASRFQPDDIHGASEVIDPAAFRWQSSGWRGRPWEEAVIYEAHVGTVTPEGSYRGLEHRLDALVDLGITAIELMPLADFPGRWDWGYNGALLFAPDSRYGRPEDLKALIDAAHARGLMMILDVVYNHFGPEGNYLHVYAKRFFDARRHTPWGAAIDFAGSASLWVREFFIENALYWLNEYRFDGLRFDAVHAIDDPSAQHFLVQLAERIDAETPKDHHIHLVLENDRNEARFLRRASADPASGFVAQWNDDLHHAAHILLTGETAGYYADYADLPGAHLARCLAEGFAYQGQPSPFRGGRRRGEPTTGLSLTAFVNFLQNHDQVGNRAFGERLSRLAPAEALRAAAAVLLLSPSPPLLFMGEEWAATEPFLFFCDLGEELRDAVRDGRRREFAEFPAFREPSRLASIPDPTAEGSFRASVLDWRARNRPPHAAMLAHYQLLLALRRTEIVPQLRRAAVPAGAIVWTDGSAFQVCWRLGSGARLSLRANLGADPRACPAAALPGRILFADPAPNASTTVLPPWSVACGLADPEP